MTEDVLVSVKGLHQTGEEQEDMIEVTSPGKYYFRNGKHFILYEEVVEETGEIIKNRVSIKGGKVEVKKSGAMDNTMVFQEGAKSNSWYNTPVGTMLAGVTVNEMVIAEAEDLIEILLKYELELNYEHIADSVIRIRVMAKNSGLFKL